MSDVVIVEPAIAPCIAELRSVYSQLREADAQVVKADRRAEEAERLRKKHREVQARLRVELGRALAEVRKQWPARGPKAKGWGEFLAREGIAERTAREYMQLAGFVDEVSATDGDVAEIPTRRDIGIDRRLRVTDETPDRWNPDDVDEPSALTSSSGTNARAGGRGKPQWLMRALVTDYTRPGDLVCDPLAGFGSTLVAAESLGRRAIGSELDAETALASGLGMIHVGDYRIALIDAGDVDAIITDPPYGARTHEATMDFGARLDGSPTEGLGPKYSAWSRDDVFEFVRHWSPRTRGWMVALTDHNLIPAWQDAYEDCARYAFAPVVCVLRGMTVRLRGDGPSSWAIYAMVARPRALANWGTLPGAYVGTRENAEVEP